MDRRQMMTAAAAGFVGAAAGGVLAGEPAHAARPAHAGHPALRRSTGATAQGGADDAVRDAAGPDTAGESTTDRARIGNIRLVSLSHVNDPVQTPVFPGDPEFKLTTAFTIPNDGFYLQYVQEGEHTGTHWGAPGHFEQGGLLADDLDPNDLLLPAVKIDIRAKAARNADYQLTVADLKDFERAYGPIPQEAAIVLWTGWEDRWGTPAYANLDGDGVIHQPGFGIESVHWLIDNGKLGRRGSLGSDTFGADPGIDDTFAASTLLFHRHRISLENLANLRQLPATGAWVLPGGPINRRGSGSPANVFGLIPG